MNAGFHRRHIRTFGISALVCYLAGVVSWAIVFRLSGPHFIIEASDQISVLSQWKWFYLLRFAAFLATVCITVGAVMLLEHERPIAVFTVTYLFVHAAQIAVRILADRLPHTQLLVLELFTVLLSLGAGILSIRLLLRDGATKPVEPTGTSSLP